MIDVEIERVTLKTERLLLRPFRLEDIDDIVEMGGFPTWDLSGPKPYTRQHAEEFLANTVVTPWNSMASFAAVLDNKVIGIINFKINRENETSTIGCSIGEEHWAKGPWPQKRLKPCSYGPSRTWNSKKCLPWQTFVISVLSA